MPSNSGDGDATGRTLKGIELLRRSDRQIITKYFIPKDSGHDYVYIDPIMPHFMDMSTPHAKLKLSDGKIQVRDCSTTHGTKYRAKGKDKEDYLKVHTDKYVTLKDGDLLIFGSGSSFRPQGLEVKLIYHEQDVPKPQAPDKISKAGSTSSKSPSEKKKKPTSTPEKTITRTPKKDNLETLPSISVEAVEPPKKDKTGDLKRSSSTGKLASKPKQPPDSSPKQDSGKPTKKARTLSDSHVKTNDNDKKERDRAPSPTPSKASSKSNEELTKLHKVINLPCTSDVRAGMGYDVLTDSFTGTYSVSDHRVKFSRDSLTTTLTGDAIIIDQHENLLTTDEIGLNVGAQVTGEASLDAKFQNLNSQTSTSSSVFIKFTMSGEYGWEELRSSPPKFIEDTANPEFYEKFGDYYVSGVKRKFGYWAVVVCQAKESAKIDSIKGEIKSHVKEVFNFGAKAEATLLEDKRWSMQHVIYGAYGYPAEVTKSNVHSAKLNDALEYLNTIRNSTPIGEIRSVRLNHVRPQSLTLNIPKEAFEQVQGMQDLCQALSLRLWNPLVRRDESLLKRAKTALLQYRRQSNSFLSRTNDTRQLQKTRQAVQQQLSKAVDQADQTVERYAFITEVRRLFGKGVRRETPRNSDKSNYWKWECGMTGAINEDEAESSKNCVQGSFHTRYWSKTLSARKASWSLVADKPRSLFSRWKTAKHVECYYDPDEKTNRLREERMVIGGDPIYIIGWSISCHPIDDKGKRINNAKAFKASIEFEQNTGDGDEGLTDNFAVNVLSDKKVMCHVQLFYILRKKYPVHLLH